MNKGRINVFALSAMLALTFPAGTFLQETYAADEVVYDGNEMDVFKRSKDDIADAFNDARLGSNYRMQDDDERYWYTSMPSLEAPYAAGTLNQDTHKAMTLMTDFYRYLVGVEPLKTTSTGSAELQLGALVRNWDFNHVIDISNKPSDMSDELWNEGAGVYHNILAMYTTPLGAITAWMNEGYDLSNGTWDTIGHRMALVRANVGELQFGYSGNVAIGRCGGTNESTHAFYAFPCPGYMPRNVLDANCSAWTIELNTSKLYSLDDSKLSVLVESLDTNTSYVCTEANGKLQANYNQLAFVQPGSGSDDYLYADGSRYRVTVTGLTDAATKKAAKLTYTTNMFDIASRAVTVPESVKTIKGCDEFWITEKDATTENLKLIMAALSDKVTVQGENGIDYTVKLKGEWVLDEENKCFKNAADKSSMPSLLKDPDKMLDDIRIYYKTDRYPSYLGRFSFYADELKEGTPAYFWLQRYISNFSDAAVYQVKKSGSKLTAKEYMNSDSDKCEKVDSIISRFNIDSLSTTDSGSYFCIYYSDYYYTKAAVVAGFTSVDTIKPGFSKAAPVLTGITNTSSGIRISWKAVTGADGYRVYRNTNGSFEKLAEVKTPYYDGIAPGYEYKIEAFSGSSTGTASNVFMVVGSGSGAGYLLKGQGSTWQYYKGSSKQSYTGFINYANKLLYVKNGIYDTGVTGLVKNGSGQLVYIKNSVYTTGFTGLLQHTDGTWYYVINGKVDQTYQNLVQNAKGTWFYVSKGKVDWSYTGLALRKENNRWFYVSKGAIDWKKTGIITHTNGAKYYVVNGAKKEDFTGLLNYSGAWYYVVKGRVDTGYKGLVLRKENNKWFYVKDGVIKWDETGLVQHTNGAWYYVVKGIKQDSYTGLVCRNGVYYAVIKGRVDWKYNGTLTYNGVSYKVVNGRGQMNK